MKYDLPSPKVGVCSKCKDNDFEEQDDRTFYCNNCKIFFEYILYIENPLYNNDYKNDSEEKNE